jgi:hypothetical protein
MTTMTATPTIAAPATFKLDITRRVSYVDCMTGITHFVFVRNYAIVG